MLALRHIYHKKRRVAPKKYHHSFLDYVIYVFAFAGPVMTIPQIYDIWVTKQISVNKITWISYLVIGVVWLFYGIIHKDKPIILSNLLGIITTGLVVAGAILYG